MDKKVKGKKIYESIDILCQEMAKFAVNSRKSKLIEEIEKDLKESQKKKKKKKNVIIDFHSNNNSNSNSISGSNSSSNSYNNINSNDDSSLKIKSKSSSNNFSSKECSRDTLKKKLNFSNKKNEKEKSIKKKVTKFNINKNKTQKLNNFAKNRLPKNNESSIKNSSTYKIKSFGEISNTKKPKNVSFSVDKKSSNKLNIYNDITDKKTDNLDKNEIKRKQTFIKLDFNITDSPIEEKEKEESEKHMPNTKKTFSGGGILKKSNKSTDFTAAFFDVQDNISRVILQSGNEYKNKKSKSHKSKFNSFILNDDNNAIDNYYNNKTKDNDKKVKSDNDDDNANANDNISFDSEKSFKTTYNKGKRKKKKVDDKIKHNKTFISPNKKKAPENSDLELKSNKSLNACDVTEGLIKFIDSSSKNSEDNSQNSKSSSVYNSIQTIFKNSLSNCVTNSENDSSLANSFNNQNKQNNNLLLHYYKNSKMNQYKNFLDKQINRQRLTQIKIDKKRKQKELKEIQSCCLSPKINSISLEIIENKGNYIPLFKRAIELENERKMKILIKQKIKDKSFIDNNSKLSKRSKRQISDFFCAQMDWKDKIEKKRKDLKSQLKKAQRQNNSEVINYEMKINPKSELIVSTKRKNNFTNNEINSVNKSDSIINNSIRLYNDYLVREKKLKKLRIELTPSFKPIIKKMPRSFYSGNISNNNKKQHFNKIDETSNDNSYNCVLYRNKSPIIIKPQKSRNKNQDKINHIDFDVEPNNQNNQKENNLKSTALDSKNTKSVQKNTLDIFKNKDYKMQNSLSKINYKDKEDKSKLNKSNYYSQKDRYNSNESNIHNDENSNISKSSENKKITIDNNSNNKNNKLKNKNNHKTTPKNSNNNKNNKNNINKIIQAIKQTKQAKNSKKKMSVKLSSTIDKKVSKKSIKIYSNKNQLKGPFYRFSVQNKKSSELFLDKNFNEITISNKNLKDENDSLYEFFNCDNIKKVKKNKIEKKILKNFKFNSSDDDQEEEEEEEEKDEIEDTESINENSKIKSESWKKKLKEISKMKNNNKNIDSETSPQTMREMKDKKIINLNGDKLYMLNVRNSSSTGNLKPYIISENTEIFYKFFVKKQNLC